MTTYIIRRLLISIPVFIGITLLVFFFVALAPGDISDGLIRPELNSDPAAKAAIIAKYGLDQPLPVRYVAWLSNAVQGQLGYRAMNGTPISEEVRRGLVNSLILRSGFTALPGSESQSRLRPVRRLTVIEAR